MCNCKRCGDEFKIPKGAIDMELAFYCKKCIKKAAQKYASMSIDECIKITAKSVLK